MEDTIWKLMERSYTAKDDLAALMFDYFKRNGYSLVNSEEFSRSLLQEGSEDSWRKFLFPMFPCSDGPARIVRASGSWSEGLNAGQSFAYKGLISELDFMLTVGKTGTQFDPLTLENTTDPGYYFIRVNDPYFKSSKFIETMCERHNDKFYLSPSKTTKYMESIVRRVFVKGEIKKPMTKVDDNSCPAITLKFPNLPFERPFKSRDLILDIVPVLESPLLLEHADLPFLSDVEKALVKEKLILLVAKSCTHHLQWRASTSLAEREIFRHVTNPIISEVLVESKIFKYASLSKDAHIKSYHLKTVLLHWLSEYRSQKDMNWKSENISKYIVELFERFSFYIESGFLPHFFFRNINLFADVDSKSPVLQQYCALIKDKECFIKYIKRLQTSYTSEQVISDDHEEEFEPIGLQPIKIHNSSDETDTDFWQGYKMKLKQIVCHIDELTNENSDKNSAVQELLQLSVKDNDHEVVEYLISNEKINKFFSAYELLHLAIKSGNEKFAKTFLSNNNVNTYYNGLTPILLAAMLDQYTIAKFLLDAGADVNLSDEHNKTPLMAAVSNSNVELILLLLPGNKTINNWHDSKLTCLHIACRKGDVDIVKILLNHGADVNKSATVFDLKQKTPLISAFHGMMLSVPEQNGREIVELLLKNGASPTPNHILSLEVPLVTAAELGYADIVKLLLAYGAEINFSRGCGNTPLHRAVAKNHVPVVDLLVKSNADKEKRDKNGLTPITLAAAAGHSTVVRLLATAGADINKQSNAGSTPLIFATTNGYVEVVKVLLDFGISQNIDLCNLAFLIASSNGHTDIIRLLLTSNVEVKSSTKDKALIHAAAAGSYIICKILITNGAAINAKNEKGWTALRNAIIGGYFDIVKLLVESGADLNLCENSGLFYLNIACGLGWTEIVKYLIANGADVSMRRGIDTNLYLATRHGHIDVVKLLLESGNSDVDVNYCGEGGNTVLVVSVQRKHMMMVELILHHGANINQPNSLGLTPLIAAVLNEHVEMVQFLLQHKPNINYLDLNNHTALFHAVLIGCFDIVQILLKHGAEFNQHSANNASIFTDPLLAVAVENGHHKIANLLLQRGIDVNQRNTNDATALCIASDIGNVDMVNLLLDYHCDIDYRTKYDDTALLLSIKKGHSNVSQVLLEGGANANRLNSLGISPLLLAQHYVRTDIMSLLLKHNADVEGLADDTTALILAIQDQNVGMVKLLLSFNAKTSVRNSRGVTPLCLAVHLNNWEIISLLLKSKADVNYTTSTGDAPLIFAVQRRYLNVAQLLLEHHANPNVRNSLGASPLGIAVHLGDMKMMSLLRAHQASFIDCALQADSALL